MLTFFGRVGLVGRVWCGVVLKAKSDKSDSSDQSDSFETPTNKGANHRKRDSFAFSFPFFALPISILFYSFLFSCNILRFPQTKFFHKKAAQQNDGRNKSGISVNKFLNIFLKNNWIIVQIVLKLNQCCLLLFLKQPLLSGKTGCLSYPEISIHIFGA